MSSLERASQHQARGMGRKRAPSPCANPDCDFIVIGTHAYYLLPKDQRGNRKPHGARGYCQACWCRLNANGTLVRKPNRGNPRPLAPAKPCRDCGRLVSASPRRPKGVLLEQGRGFCARCRRVAIANDTYDDYEPRIRRNVEVVEEYLELRLVGVADIKVAAPRMGMTPSALERALQRARQRGDERLAS